VPQFSLRKRQEPPQGYAGFASYREISGRAFPRHVTSAAATSLLDGPRTTASSPLRLTEAVGILR